MGLVTRELYASEIEDDVAGRTIDIGLVRCPTGRPGTLHEQISHEPLALAVSAQSPFARKRRIALHEVASHRLAMWPRDLIPCYFDACMSAWQEAGGTRDHIDTSSSGAALWSYIASDRTVGLVVRSFERTRPRDIRIVQLRENTDVGVSIVWPAAGRTPATDRVLELARRRPAPDPG